MARNRYEAPDAELSGSLRRAYAFNRWFWGLAALVIAALVIYAVFHK